MGFISFMTDSLILHNLLWKSLEFMSLTLTMCFDQVRQLNSFGIKIMPNLLSNEYDEMARCINTHFY